MLAIPGMAPPEASAQTPPTQPEFHFQYSYFREHQGSNEDRMKINVPQVYLKTPILDQGALELTYTYDGMTGASPLYLDTLTGASELGGVDDERHAGDWKYTHYEEEYSVATGMTLSDEDDWSSIGGSAEIQRWTEDRNTTISVGFSGVQDDIRSTNNDEISEDRTTLGGYFGVTQIINPELIMQWNATFYSGSGYHTDPYKVFDNRPSYRDEFAFMTRAIQYLESIDGSLHADYRFYYNNHGIASHTFENEIYYPVGEKGLARFRGRFYTQNAADFFSSEIDLEAIGRGDFISLDQRVSAFGSYLIGTRYDHEISDGFTIFGSLDYSRQDAKYRLGGSGSAETPKLTFYILSVGFMKSFSW
jgi:hypothetical protein